MTLPEVLSVIPGGPDEVTIELRIPADSDAFAGHFPGQPILPGVVQIDWAVRLADRYLAAGIGAAQDFQVKFRNIARPDSLLRLALRLDRQGRALIFEFLGADETISGGRIRLGGDP